MDILCTAVVLLLLFFLFLFFRNCWNFLFCTVQQQTTSVGPFRHRYTAVDLIEDLSLAYNFGPCCCREGSCWFRHNQQEPLPIRFLYPSLVARYVLLLTLLHYASCRPATSLTRVSLNGISSTETLLLSLLLLFLPSRVCIVLFYSQRDISFFLLKK